MFGGECFTPKSIYLIGTGKDYSKIVNVLALISGRTIQEIEDISLYGENLQYFLLSEAQKISSNSLK
ncbi:MAG: hypothetical protein QG558_1531 [Campylobacterota bacterium]|nr:hypothetical protein [Campylobacterota bacterium]